MEKNSRFRVNCENKNRSKNWKNSSQDLFFCDIAGNPKTESRIIKITHAISKTRNNMCYKTFRYNFSKEYYSFKYCGVCPSKIV